MYSVRFYFHVSLFLFVPGGGCQLSPHRHPIDNLRRRYRAMVLWQRLTAFVSKGEVGQVGLA